MTEYVQAELKLLSKDEKVSETKDENRAVQIEPTVNEPPQIKEVKFFSDPKAVKKKTQRSIIAFQVIFTALFCLVYKLTALLAPELYLNVSTYLERLFGW